MISPWVLPGYLGRGACGSTGVRHYLGTPAILGEPSSGSPWEFPEICGEDLLVGLCVVFLRHPHKCYQEHMGDMSLGLLEGPGKDHG